MTKVGAVRTPDFLFDRSVGVVFDGLPISMDGGLVQISDVKSTIRHCFEQCDGQGGAHGQMVGAALRRGVLRWRRPTGIGWNRPPCPRIRRRARPVGMCRCTGGVVADGDRRAGFRYPVVGWILADDGVDHGMNILNPYLPRAPHSSSVFIVSPSAIPAENRKHRCSSSPVEPLVSLR